MKTEFANNIKESVQQEVPQVLIKYAFREVRAEIARPFCREFTTIKRRERLLERFLKQSIVELLTLRANCSLFVLFTTCIIHKAR